ncbi:MAG: hypothetical protein JXA82_00050 [Sedimentisphaerales bacterium]|nr:hypothetical protein [Sedimentisphaerales bacterium]
MATRYSPNYFLRQTPNALLEQYFQNKNIDPFVTIDVENKDGTKSSETVKISKLEENQTQPILDLIETQGFEQKTAIENDFRQISERSCKAGFLCLLDEARYEGHGVDIQDKLKATENHYERSMWVFLNYPIIFQNSGYFQRSDKSTFRARPVWKNITPKQLDGDLKEFKNNIIEHYKKEGRGNHCVVEVLKRPDPERYYYFVYLEDYSNTIEEFKDTEFKRTPVKPAFEVIFAYHPKNGKIETNASGIKQEITQLQEAFCQGILDMEGLPDKDSRMYTIEKLKNKFDFTPRDPQDNIAAVHLRLIELEFSSKKRITFTDNGKTPNIYDMIEKALNKQNVPLDIVTVSKARIQILFRKMANEKRAQTITFEISTPDRCTLKDSPVELIAKKHVEKWGLVDEQVIDPLEEKNKIEPVKQSS